MNKQQGIISPIVIVIIVIAVLGVGGFVAYTQYSEKITEEQVETDTETNTENTENTTNGQQETNTNETTTQQQTEIAGWKTYKSEKFGFQIDYPDNWTMKDYEQSWGGAEWNSPIFRPEQVFIEVGIFPVATFENLVNGCPTTSNTDKVIGKVMFSGLEFCKVLNKGGTDGNPPKGAQVITYSIINGDNGDSGYKIRLNILGGNQTTDFYLPESEFAYESNVISQMLSTFKFITPTDKNAGQAVSLTVWPDKNSFDLNNKTFSAKNLNTQKNIKIVANDSTKIYNQSSNGQGEMIKDYQDFQWLSLTLKNWVGPPWWFDVKGSQQADGSVLADEIYYTIQ
jgi:hypothetical protein